MTLITPLPNGATSTGREIADARHNLSDTRDNVQDVHEKTGNIKDLVEAARWSLEQVSEVRAQATEFLASITSMQFALKLSSRVGPMATPSKAMITVLDRLEEVAKTVRDKAAALERKIEKGDYIDRLKKAEDRLDEFGDGLEATDARLGEYEDSVATMVAAFDLVGAPLAPFEAAASGAARPVNDVLVPINRLYDGIEAHLQGFDDAFAAADNAAGLFDSLADVTRAFGQINGALAVLAKPLRTLQEALHPVEWLLDAVGVVYDVTVGPVVDYLIDTLGVTDLLDRISDEIAAHLPDPGILDALAARIDAALAEVTGFIGGLDDTAQGWAADITDYVNDIQDDVIAALNAAAPDAIRMGGDGHDRIFGRSGGLDLLSGLGGNDTLFGGASAASVTAQGDIFVASAGDDENHGGAGIDWLLLGGSVLDWRISQFSATAPVVFFDTTGLRGREVAHGIDRYVFGDGIFTLAQLQALGLLAPPATNGHDLIIGGTGDDSIYTMRGRDSVEGGAGSDSWLLPLGADASLVEVRLAYPYADPAGRMWDGYAWDGRERDYLRSVENVTVETNTTARLWGTEGANGLIAGGARDYLNGRGGNDVLIAGAGRDYLIGGAGSDTLLGGDDYDTLIAGPARAGERNLYDGGAGTDRVVYATGVSNYGLYPDGVTIGYNDLPASGPLRVDAATNTVAHLADGRVIATDTLRAIEIIIAGDGADTLTGSALPGTARTIDGGGGDDLIETAGTPTVRGGGGRHHRDDRQGIVCLWRWRP